MADIDQVPTPVLPRELTDISDAAREVSAPPTPIVAEPYSLRLVDSDTDAEMISEWMNRPHLVEAWEYDWPPARWQLYLRVQLDGEYSRSYVGSFRGGDFGYVELYRAAKDSIAPRYDADPHDIGLHAAIAELKFVNRGIGPFVLPRIVANVFELERPSTRCRGRLASTTISSRTGPVRSRRAVRRRRSTRVRAPAHW